MFDSTIDFLSTLAKSIHLSVLSETESAEPRYKQSSLLGEAGLALWDLLSLLTLRVEDRILVEKAFYIVYDTVYYGANLNFFNNFYYSRHKVAGATQTRSSFTSSKPTSKFLPFALSTASCLRGKRGLQAIPPMNTSSAGC